MNVGRSYPNCDGLRMRKLESDKEAIEWQNEKNDERAETRVVKEDKEPLKRDAFKCRSSGETACLEEQRDDHVPGNGGSDRQEKKTKHVVPALMEKIRDEVAERKQNRRLT